MKKKYINKNPIGEIIELLIMYAKENLKLKSKISMLEYEKKILQEKIIKLNKDFDYSERNNM